MDDSGLLQCDATCDDEFYSFDDEDGLFDLEDDEDEGAKETLHEDGKAAFVFGLVDEMQILLGQVSCAHFLPDSNARSKSVTRLWELYSVVEPSLGLEAALAGLSHERAIYHEVGALFRIQERNWVFAAQGFADARREYSQGVGCTLKGNTQKIRRQNCTQNLLVCAMLAGTIASNPLLKLRYALTSAPDQATPHDALAIADEDCPEILALLAVFEAWSRNHIYTFDRAVKDPKTLPAALHHNKFLTQAIPRLAMDVRARAVQEAQTHEEFNATLPYLLPVTRGESLLCQDQLRDPITTVVSFLTKPWKFRMACHFLEMCVDHARYLEVPMNCCKHGGLSSTADCFCEGLPRPPVPMSQRALTAADPDQSGSMLNDYVLLHVIGEGCYGVVRQAYHLVQQRMFAVKVRKRGPQHQPLHPSHNPQGTQPHVPVQEARDVAIQREIAVMKKLRHKNIVSLFEVIDDPQQQKLYLIMQYIDDGAVGQVGPDMLCTTRLDPTTMANYGRQICAGLHYLHNHNVVHRDIRPGNILKDSSDQVYLAGFGLSEMFDQAGAESSKKASPEGEMTARTQVAGRHGTPAFMAPELLSHDPLYEHDGMALDVWALGVTFYCFLVGRLPFRSRSEIMHADLGMPAHVPSEWAVLLMQMLQKDPKDRPSIADVRKMVKTLQEAGAPQPETVDTDMTASDNLMSADVASAFTPRLDSATSSAFRGEGGTVSTANTNTTHLTNVRNGSRLRGRVGCTMIFCPLCHQATRCSHRTSIAAGGHEIGKDERL